MLGSHMIELGRTQWCPEETDENYKEIPQIILKKWTVPFK